jgi:hypothetical protein
MDVASWAPFQVERAQIFDHVSGVTESSTETFLTGATGLGALEPPVETISSPLRSAAAVGKRIPEGKT